MTSVDGLTCKVLRTVHCQFHCRERRFSEAVQAIDRGPKVGRAQVRVAKRRLHVRVPEDLLHVGQRRPAHDEVARRGMA